MIMIMSVLVVVAGDNDHFRRLLGWSGSQLVSPLLPPPSSLHRPPPGQLGLVSPSCLSD